MYQTIVQAVLAHGEENPEQMAVIFKKNQISYRQLCEQVKKFAAILKTEYGVKKDDLVMVSAVSKPDYVVALFGIQYLGAVSVPIDKSAKEANIVDVYEYIHPKLLLTDSRLSDETLKKDSLKNLYARVEQEDIDVSLAGDYEIPDQTKLAEILFTTGTTGKPKGAMLTYSNLYASTHNTWKGIGMLASDRILLPLPLNHSVGMRVLRTTFYIGATLVIQNGFTFAKELETNIIQNKCTGLVSVPASIEVVFRQMQERFAEVLGNLRYIEFGAGSLSYDMKKKLLKILPNTLIHNTWGSTETGGAIFLNVTEHPDKLTSLGKPMDGVQLKVVNQQGEEIEAHDIDTAGRMVLKGQMQMAGYYEDPEKTAETLVDGWLYTNDVVYTDADGFVYMLGRADDIINVGGEKVSPIEVENIAQEFEEIRECACIGVDDPDGLLGRVPVLYVVLEGAAFHQDELVKFLADRMERYKLPHKYILIQELPRNRMKKLDRKALYRMWEENGEEELMNDTIRNLLNRRSVRDFTDKKIEKKYLEMMLKTAYHAPSGHNMQTWHFSVVTDEDKIAKFKEVVDRVAKEKKVYFYGFNNPTALIFVSNDKRNENAIQDCSCAAENIMLAAQSYEIGSVWLNALKTICDEPEIRELLNELAVPANHIVWSTIALGYPSKPAKLLAKKENVISWIE